MARSTLLRSRYSARSKARAGGWLERRGTTQRMPRRRKYRRTVRLRYALSATTAAGRSFGRPRPAGVQQARSSVSGSVVAGPVTQGLFMAIEIVAGALFALVLVFFFLRDGDRMWSWFGEVF